MTRLFSNSDASQFAQHAGHTIDGMVKQARASTTGKTVFLSHSSKDDALVPGVVAFFRQHNAEVYADDFDKSLPSPPNPATAAILKGQIRKLPRLVVLATPNSHTSRWIPWELGLGDGYHEVPPNAIFPITPDGEIPYWLSTEYYQLYPRIQNVDGTWQVTDPTGITSWPLESWLNENI